MMPPSPTPKLPLWIFILTDVALLLAGLLVAARSSSPLSSTAVLAIVACVIAGAIVLFVPLVIHIEREKNEALDDRQRALEALAATVTTSAEQISIAAQGLHAIAELAQKNLRQAEQLPAVLEAKVAEFENLLTNAQTEERDELKTELARLRASESERLEAVAKKVDHASGELTKLEAAAHQHLLAAQAALASAPQALTAATQAALAQISSALAAVPASDPRRSQAGEGSPNSESAPKEPRSAKATAKPAEEGLHIIPVVPPTAAPFSGDIVSIAPEVTVPPFAGSFLSSPPATHLTPAPAESAPPADLPAAVASAPEVTANAGVDPASPSPTLATEESKPVKKRAPRKPKPVETPETSLTLATSQPAVAATTPDDPSVPAQPASVDGEIPALRNDSGNSEFSQIAPDESLRQGGMAENVLSSDGATRLLVTAYIGIGNRLFIRGAGPGLSWDKGVPLQFVSIGKWRWETSDATAPVKYKLYKNDELECTTLGSQSLPPDHQQEITATF